VPLDGVRPLAATVARGVSYAHDWSDRGARGYGTPSDRAQLDRLRALGATWVCVMPFGYLRSRDEFTVRSSYARDGAERDAALVATIREAHARGLHVLLKPHLWVHGSWPGEVDPAREDDARALVDSWALLTRHYADLAAREHVEALTVGVEMDRLARRVPDRWRVLIADARTRYHGTLTYAANWSELATVPFWDALDVVSVNHYAPLANAPGPSGRADVDARARAALAAHVAVARRYGRRLWLTEVGFRRDARALVEPWAWVQQSQAPVMELQSTGYAATFRAIAAEPTVSAVFAWKWFTSGGDEEEGERGFVFTGRPAEAIIRRAFARP
jgi:hypothetical protein